MKGETPPRPYRTGMMGARALAAALLLCGHTALAFLPPGGTLLPGGRARARGHQTPALLRMATIDATRIRAISLDVTGTILVHRDPIMETYAAAARWARLPDPPSAAELKPAFKKAYFKHLTESPCFGHAEGLSSRQWWVRTVRSALEFCGRTEYTEQEFSRFFRRVYQVYGSLDGYERLPDAIAFLDWAGERGLTMGVTTNTPVRTMETVLPMTGHMDVFRWYVCSQDVGVEKPGPEIFERAYEEAQFWLGPLDKDEILHIGDSFEADYCGARAFGFQALHLDRSDNARVTVYQDWLQAPDYPGKSEDDIRENTVKDLSEVRALLEDEKDDTSGGPGGGAVAVAAPAPAPAPAPASEAAAPIPPAVREYQARLAFNRGKKADPNQPSGKRFDWKEHQAKQRAQGEEAAEASQAAASGEYHDGNEVDRTTMEGHVTQVGEKISELVDVVRGEVIETATAESDVEEETWQREYEKAFGCPPPMEKLYDDEVQGMAGWYEGDVDRERELARAKAQGWIDDEPAALSLRAAAAAPPPATRTEQDAGDIGEDGDDDFSPQARFLRDRQRLQQKSIVKGAAETDASLPASRRPTDQKQKWEPPGGYGYVPKKRRAQGVAQVTSSSPAEATASAPSPTATQGMPWCLGLFWPLAGLFWP